MGRPKGSKNKNPYPVNSHRNSYWIIFDIGLDFQLQCFKGMHNRVRDGKCPSIEWPRTFEGFVEFLDEIGDIPTSIERPTVGRLNHKFGYISGNVEWQEYAINSKLRKGTRYESDAYPA